MAREKLQSGYGSRFRRNRIIHAMLMVFVVIIAALAVLLYFNWQSRLGDEKTELSELWNTGSYEAVYRLSGERLAADPMNYNLLTLRGFSSCQLALAQINNFDMLTYINECIWSLRKALLINDNQKDGGLFYILGKAYYYKGSGYEDLAIKFLEAAKDLSYHAQDIQEYLGIVYASVHDYRRSVASFTMALNPANEVNENPSDLLLLSIARSYIELGETDAAKAYLIRCTDISRDSNNLVKARLLLGGILTKEGDTSGAEAQYLSILNGGIENAEAHFQLGELYNAGGDAARARAEWRRAVRIDPAYGPARVRLNM
jgi:tetratricopeptide (TPR) repeat protein